MTQRDIERAQSSEQAMQEYIRQTAASSSSGGGVAEELTKLADLRDRGVITDAEFQAQKSKLMV